MLALLTLLTQLIPAFGLSLGNDLASIQNDTLLIVKGILDYYPISRPGWVPGMFQSPYYWWEAGAVFGVMIDWQYLTEQDDYTDLIKLALTHQAGPGGNYMPSNQSTTEGNDDQGFWGLTAMTAAERNFSNPSSDQPGWLYSAQAVFNDMARRWDTSSCGGGLRWQIYTWNSGYTYKNTVSNGCLFNLGARLARYTGNSSYGDWATKVWNWIDDVELLTTVNDEIILYDGATMDTNCTSRTEIEWTYNYGLMISGCAYMSAFENQTDVQSSMWVTRATELWDRAKERFFENEILYEASCQPTNRCNNDQRVFKAIFLQLVAQAASLVPSLENEIMTYLNTTAQAAAESCSGGSDGHTCGLNWFEHKWDGMYGLGEQASALAAISVMRTMAMQKPLTGTTGGTSNGSASAGGSSSYVSGVQTSTIEVKGKDRAGAAIITVVLLLFLIGSGVWVII